MAKKNLIAREKKRLKLSNNPAVIAKRAALKKVVCDNNSTYEEKTTARNKLSKDDNNKSKTRSNTRCTLCGRVHSVLKKFRLCRLCFRKEANNCNLPGIRKASW